MPENTYMHAGHALNASSHQGADVAAAVRLSAMGSRVLDVLNVCAQVIVPEVVVALVEAVDLARLGDLDVSVTRLSSGHITEV